MSKQVKFTEEEIKQLNGIREEYINIQSQFGQLAVSKIRLESDMDNLSRLEEDLHKSFIVNNKSEQDFVDGITKKYGDGTFNPDTGIFTPNK